MPVIDGPLITESSEAVDLLCGILDADKVALGIGYIGKNDERRLPQYPAVVVSAGPRTKEVHGTHKFLITLRCLIWVYHAKMSESHAQRSQEDLQLVTAIERALEADYEYGGKLIFGHVESDQGGVMQPRSQKSDMVVGTRMSWTGLTQQMWT